MSAERLDHEAVVAHRRGIRWTDWWPTVAHDVAQVEPHDTARYGALVGRLLALVTSGDLNGLYPVGNALVPQTADVAKPADTGTVARIDWGRARVVPTGTLPILTPPLRGIGTVGPMTDGGARKPVGVHGTVSL